MASISLGKIAFTWKGAYDAGTTYSSQDVVSSNGNSYVCTLDNTVGITPVVGANWSLFAQGAAAVTSTAGEIIYNDGTGLVALPVGTAGQVLQVDKVTLLPVWGPADVRSATRVKALPASMTNNQQPNVYRFHGAIMNDDSIRMWGNNGNYNLGDGTTNARSYPVRPGFPPTFPGAATLYLFASGSSSMSACIDLDGKLWTWGYNGYGQQGTGSTVSQTIPYCPSDNALNSINGKVVTHVAVQCGVDGYGTTHVLCSDGTVHSSGYNGYGQIGNGGTVQQTYFQQALSITNVTQLSAGRERYGHVAAVANGQLYTWGYGANGRLGSGATTDATIPVARTGGSLAGKTIVKCWAGWGSTYALDSEGTLHGTGLNTDGQLGIGNATDQLLFVAGTTDVAEAFIGCHDYPVAFVIKTDGTVWAAGAGNYGANGDVNSVDITAWQQLDFGTKVATKVIHGGTGTYNWTQVLFDDGTAHSWGYNGNGALMSGDTSNYLFTAKRTIPTGNLKIVDMTCWGQSSEQAVGYLMEDGQFLVGGYAGGSSLPEDDSENSYAPMPVPF